MRHSGPNILDYLVASAKMGRLEYVIAIMDTGKITYYEWGYCYGVMRSIIFRHRYADYSVTQKKQEEVFDYLHNIKRERLRDVNQNARHF